MKIAVLSGKGGTGKTLVSVNLACAAKASIYIDCDVEEPNGHLFFKPSNIKEEKVEIKIPYADNNLCTGCRRCVDFCKFNALAYINGKLKIFDEICHSCGGCVMMCPANAISEREKAVGKIQEGVSGNVTVNTGELNPGEASGIPIIKKLLKDNRKHRVGLTFIDCPPGSSCSVMEIVKDADYCVLVAEPTLYGAHNLNMVYELAELYKKPCGVILNKYQEGDNPSEYFCMQKGIEIVGRIPFNKELGLMSSNAKIAFRESEKYRVFFSALFHSLIREVRHETTVNP